jgi:hypothetical protein
LVYRFLINLITQIFLNKKDFDADHLFANWDPSTGEAETLERLARQHKATILECIASNKWFRARGDVDKLRLEDHTLWAGYTAMEQTSTAAEKQGYATSYKGKLYSSIKSEEFDNPPPKRMVLSSGCKKKRQTSVQNPSATKSHVVQCWPLRKASEVIPL